MKIIKFKIDGLDLVSDNDRLAPTRGGRLYATAKYKAYKNALVTLIRLQLPLVWETFPKYFGVRIIVWTYKDQSNLIKAVLDALECAGIITNDRYCDRLYMVKHALKKGETERMKIEVIDRENSEKVCDPSEEMV